MTLDINYTHKNKRVLIAHVGQFVCHIRRWKKPKGLPFCVSVYSKKLKLFVYEGAATLSEAIALASKVVGQYLVCELNLKSVAVSSTINNKPITKE